MRPSRLAWLMPMLLLFAAAVQGGTEDDPEITDGADVEGDVFEDYAAIDVRKVWIDHETNESIFVIIQVEGDIEPSETPTQQFTYTLNFTYAGTPGSYVARSSSSNETGGTFEGAQVTIALNRASYKPGQTLGSLFVATDGWTVSAGTSSASDRAPNENFGRDYLVGMEALPGVDYDGDGVDDRDEVRAGTNPTVRDTDQDFLDDGKEQQHGTDPLNPDSDDDGLLDGDEVDLGTDPLKPDSDDDGLLDGDEVDLGTDPLNPDSDDDGLSDGDEVFHGSDPLKQDSDGDGISDGDEVHLYGSDPTDTDTDNDGLTDKEEVDHGLDPTDPSDAAQDNDGDGVTNLEEIARGTDPNVSDQTAVEDALPGDLPLWMWLVIVGCALLVLILIVWLIILARRRDDEPEEEAIPADELEVIELVEGDPEAGRAASYKPFVLTREYLTEGLDDEALARAHERYVEREKRYLDRVHPDRDRSFDDELFRPLTEGAAGAKAAKADKAARQAEKQAAKADKLASKDERQAAKQAARDAKKGGEEE